MSIPIKYIIKELNTRFRHRFPDPSAPEEHYTVFENKCEKCSSVLEIFPDLWNGYAIQVNSVYIDYLNWDFYEDDLPKLLCKKLKSFL